MEDKIIWQSPHFPKLILTQSHLEMLRYVYPQVKHFEPHLKEAELWLADHPTRHPAKNWRTFITNWIKNSVRYEQERQAERRPEQGDAARRTPGDAKVVGEILRKAME